MNMATMPLGEVKARLSELVSRVTEQHERITVTVRGRPQAVLIAMEDLDALEDTLAVLADPVTLQRLVNSDAEIARGETVDSSELTAILAARRRFPA